MVTGNGPAGQTRTFARTGSRLEVRHPLGRHRRRQGPHRLRRQPVVRELLRRRGGASSLFTWQGAAGVGYSFKWGDVVFDYRYLYYSQSGDSLIDNLSFGGFALGANFRF